MGEKSSDAALRPPAEGLLAKIASWRSLAVLAGGAAAALVAWNVATPATPFDDVSPFLLLVMAVSALAAKGRLTWHLSLAPVLGLIAMLTTPSDIPRALLLALLGGTVIIVAALSHGETIPFPQAVALLVVSTLLLRWDLDGTSLATTALAFAGAVVFLLVGGDGDRPSFRAIQPREPQLSERNWAPSSRASSEGSGREVARPDLDDCAPPGPPDPSLDARDDVPPSRMNTGSFLAASTPTTRWLMAVILIHLAPDTSLKLSLYPLVVAALAFLWMRAPRLSGGQALAVSSGIALVSLALLRPHRWLLTLAALGACSRNATSSRAFRVIPAAAVLALLAFSPWRGATLALFPAPLAPPVLILGALSLTLFTVAKGRVSHAAATATMLLALFVAFEAPQVSTPLERTVSRDKTVEIPLPTTPRALYLFASGTHLTRVERGRPLAVIDLVDRQGQGWRREVRTGEIVDWAALRYETFPQARMAWPGSLAGRLQGWGARAFVRGTSAVRIEHGQGITYLRISLHPNAPSSVSIHLEGLATK